MKTLKVPYIENVESLPIQDLDYAMQNGAPRQAIDCINWPDYPHRPSAIFSVARSATHLAVLFHVVGMNLRALAGGDNGRVWEDSCCEVFISDPCDGTYYNFEVNCIGDLLAAKRKSREDAEHFSPEKLARIRRLTTLERKPYDESGRTHSWSVGLCIPFDLIGTDPDHLPESLRANFYKCADLSAHPHFLSWSPIDTPTPDFHRPEFFGKIVL